MIRCKVCDEKTLQVINFGKMPIANGFVKKPRKNELVFTLNVVFCPKCYMVQLSETVPPEKMFHDHYQFFSSTSAAMGDHFKKEADEIKKIVSKKRSPFIVEIGSNDGIMLKHIAKSKLRHVGVEPSENVAAVSKKQGVNVTTDFFNKNTAQKILKKYGPADVICGSNVICHIEDINSVFEGVTQLLADDGVFFFEEPYIYDIVKYNSFDQIYDEHVFFYSGLSVKNLAKRHGLMLVNMKHQDVHGGSMRYYIKREGRGRQFSAMRRYIATERRAKLHKIDGYKKFKKNVNKLVTDLKKLLIKLKKQNVNVVGYAATSKSTTFLNYAGIGPEFIKYISDTTPTKVGLLTPGTHIPVKSHDEFTKEPPSYALLFAYNHKKEIFKKEKTFRRNGGKFIIYFPKVAIE